MNGVLNCEDLKLLTGYQRAGDVARCLKEQGVKVFWGKSGPWTTLKALHVAQELEHANRPTVEPLDF